MAKGWCAGDIESIRQVFTPVTRNVQLQQKLPMTDPRPEDAFVRFVNVQKSYDGEILVVKDLNLDIAQGEFLTRSGPPAPERPPA